MYSIAGAVAQRDVAPILLVSNDEEKNQKTSFGAMYGLIVWVRPFALR